MRVDGPLLECSTQAEWRSWLAAHCASEQAVWLVYGKKGSGILTVTYREALEEALCYGWIDGVVRRIDAARYMQRWSPRKPKSTWSETNKRLVQRLSSEGRMAEPGQQSVNQAKEAGNWDTPATQAPAKGEPGPPPDLLAALDAVPGARLFFDTLPPSLVRQYLSWILDARRPETRARRIQAAVDACAAGRKGTPGFDLKPAGA